MEFGKPTGTRPVALVIIGAGDRGRTYARYAELHPARARIEAVAEPNDQRRERFARHYGLPPERVFRDWREVVDQPQLADAVVICTQDADHAAPAIRFAECGYHILLEKPMAPNADACRRIVASVEQAGVMLAVAHVLRYTPLVRHIRRQLDVGAIGELQQIQHLEQVGHWHFAHSFVRGSWRREDEASPLLLAKSCHDLDLLRYYMGRRCQRVSSFGARTLFRAEQRPEGAADYCLDCGLEATCPYSAPRLYLGQLEQGNTEWPLHIITEQFTREAVLHALREGPYGRCVYACDNDVVDQQVVNLAFEGGRTASFTLAACTGRVSERATRFFGSEGEMRVQGSVVETEHFVSGEVSRFDAAEAIELASLGGHGGGDGGLIAAFVQAVASGDESMILSGPQETLESHLIVFAAEVSRRSGGDAVSL